MFQIFPWNKHLEIGIAEIDKQHRHFLTLLNRLANLVATSPQRDSLKIMLEELAEHATHHFKTEEKIWQQLINDSNQQQDHEKSHQVFLSKILSYAQQLNHENAEQVAMHAVEYLSKWLVAHIIDTDRSLAHFAVAKKSGLTDAEALLNVQYSTKKESTQKLIALIDDLYVKNVSSRIQNIREINALHHTNDSLNRQHAYRELILQVAMSFINLPLEGINFAIEDALALISEFMLADRAYIFQYDFNNQSVSNTHEWCASDVEPMIQNLQQLPIALASAQLPLHRAGKPHVVHSVEDLPASEYKALLESQEIKSLITMPLISHGRCTGFVGFDSTKKVRHFEKDEQDILKLFTNILTNINQRQAIAQDLKQKTDELSLAHKRLINILNGVNAVVYVADMDTYEVLFVNEQGRQAVGDIVGKTCWKTIQLNQDGPCNFCTNKALLNEHGEPNPPIVWEHYNPALKQWYQLHDQAILWNDGRYVRLEIAVNITQRKTLELSLQESEKRYRSLFEQSRDALMIISPPEWRLSDGNAAMIELFGAKDLSELLSLSPADLSPHKQPCGTLSSTLCQQEVENALKNGSSFFEWVHKRLDGKEITCAVLLTRNEIEGETVIQGTVRDITEQKIQQLQLERIAHYDVLTSMPNRVLLADRMKQAMSHAKRTHTVVAIAYLDIDGFKMINDQHGHNSGDRFLVQLSKRMRNVLRETDTLARIGGDEFVIVMGDFQNPDASLPVFDRLLEEASHPFSDGENQLQVSASLGITFYPQADVLDADQLLRQADQAMYQAKLAGKNRYHLFDLINDKAQRGHHSQIARLQTALQTEEFILFYQPKVNMKTGRVLGVEALIRWQHPELGCLGPDQFLPLIEGHPLEVSVDNWVLETAVKQMSAWHQQGIELPISINLGAYQLQSPDFVQTLRNTLHRYPDCLPEHLELEILESSALSDLERVTQVMNECISLGVRFALDDFGTGYSSLTYLKRLPAESLKIDRSFVGDMLEDPDDHAILEGVLGLARAFGRQAIAEGVETEAQGIALLALGCEVAQGYYIARPQPASDVIQWMKAWKKPDSWKDSIYTNSH